MIDKFIFGDSENRIFQNAKDLSIILYWEIVQTVVVDVFLKKMLVSNNFGIEFAELKTSERNK